MKIIDLAGTIEPGMWGFGDPCAEVSLEQIGSIEKEGWISHNVRLAILSGTYMETGAHLIPGVRSIDQVGVEELAREAAVIDVSPKQGLEIVSGRELRQKAPKIEAGDAIIIKSGWCKKWNSEQFISHSPYFDEEAIGFLMEKKVPLVASDMVCFDDPRGGGSMPLLKKLFQSNALVLSPLVNLDQIKKPRVKLIALPLKLKGCSASPCRVVAILE